ncbi:hypothetical protein [Acidovorax sp. M2(2025)]|uniref:hypothetical protein n=1 Tax=Acidovorax sp. M2(2025) TaxID=3411355 RepID=UPI003BF5875B
MASAHALKRLDRLVWVLIYGGLFGLVLGIATARAGSDALGWALGAGGGAVTLAGVVLIAVRSRLREDGAP